MSRIKNLISMTGADTFGTIISAAFWFILAGLMLPEEYGEIQYFLGIAGIAYGISLIGTSQTMSVFVAKKIQLEKTIIILALIIASISAIVIGFIFFRIDIGFLVIGYIINDLSIGYLLGKKLFPKYSKFFLTQKSLTFGLGLIFYFIIGPEGIIYALALSYIHLVIIIIPILRKSNLDFSLFKKHYRFTANNYFINISGLFRGQVDKIIIVPLIGFELLGNYALAIQVYAILMIASNVFFKYILPHDASDEKIGNIRYFTMLIAIATAIFGMTLVPELLGIFFPKFIEVGNVIQIISIAVIPTTITLLYTSRFLGKEKSSVVLIGKILLAITIISLLIILAPIYGVIGAAIAFVSASIVNTSFLVVMYHIKNKAKKQ